jgi:hypothetical protein
MGYIAQNSIFTAGQAFLSNEATEDYTWVLRWLKDWYNAANILLPLTLTTDAAEGIRCALKVVFPDVPHLLCTWHLNNDLEAWYK